MAIFSKELCKRKLNTWLAAEDAISTGQSYKLENRQLTRADLYTVRQQIEYWAGKLEEAEAEENGNGRNRVYRVVPRRV